MVATSCISTFSDRASKRLNMLEALRETLPVAMNSELIKEEERIVRSHVPKCARVQILQLYGTNSEAFEEVIDYYESHIDQNTWHIERTSEDSVSFVESNNIDLGVSRSIEWPSAFTQEVQKDMENFDTLFLVILGSFIDPDVTVEQCT